MVKKKQRRRYLIPLGVLLFVLFIFGITWGAFASSDSHVSYVYDKDLGYIKIDMSLKKGMAKFFNLFQQAVMFDQETATVGDTITLTDTYEVLALSESGDGYLVCKLGYLDININLPDGTVVTTGTTFPEASPLEILVTDTSFLATQEGAHDATTYYYESLCDPLFEGSCQSSELCPGIWEEASENSVAVVASDCTLTCGCGEYTTTTTETWGIVKMRECDQLNIATCECEPSDNEYLTECISDQYQIVGTTGQSVANEETTCELIPAGTLPDCESNENCTTGQVCNPLGVCVSIECNGPDTKFCPDDSSFIVLKECVNGLWGESTGLDCVANNSTDVDDNGFTTIGAVDMVYDIEETETSTTVFVIIVIVIGFGLVILAYIIIKVVGGKRKKKRR